ncbi:MAG TPA: sigma 54-interacting transcriptional regulator, partial [Methylomirabilota bacterium]|nr:sigma 54-interacting transcriptional regulator [Methylomirabilota bacterium]
MELVADAIHQLSGRRAARFEAVNCGGLSRELLRSELFGHERGAFTGAVERHSGLLTMAHGGTVFLDEVGDLAPEAQVMLLRFLAGGEIRPVGSTRATHGGTVFLDEVGDLAPEAQVMLLRFLADGEIRPVGSTRVSHADVRV